MRLAALVITHNSAGDAGACLEACLRFREEFAEGILVVDNASKDATRHVVRAQAGVRLIENRENRGFAGAVNQGIAALEGAEAVLVLNPDVRIASPPGLLARALEADPVVALAGGLLMGEDGRAQRGFHLRRLPTPAALAFEALGWNRLFPGNAVNRRYRALDLAPDEPARNLQPAGACMLVRRRAWTAVGGLDEGFHPVWFEDVDFAARLLAGGWATEYVPQFAAIHTGGRSIAGLEWERRQLYWYSSQFRYVSRHFRATGRWAVCLAAATGLLARGLRGMVWQRSVKPLAVCGRLVRLAMAAAAGDLSRKAIARSSEVACEPAGAQERSSV